jgi:hypothetical protein
MKKIVFTIGVLAALLFGYKTYKNIGDTIKFNSKITSSIALSGATTTISKLQNVKSDQSMESMLEEALINVRTYKDENFAIFYHTEFYNSNNFIELIEESIKRAKELGMLDQAYKTGKVDDSAPDWVKYTFNSIKPKDNQNPQENRVLSSELGSVVKNMYEAFGDAVSGGVTVSGDNVKVSNMALVCMLDNVSTKAWWPTSHANFSDMKNAWANTYFALLYANMGNLKKATDHLTKTSEILDKYPDNADLAIIVPGYKNLTMSYLKGSVKSAIDELNALDNMDIKDKYTSGWWGNVQKKAQSLGSGDVFIGEISKSYSNRLKTRIILWGVLGLGGLILTAYSGLSEDY